MNWDIYDFIQAILCGAVVVLVFLILQEKQSQPNIPTLPTITIDWREAARILEDCDGNVTIKQKYVDGVLTWFLDDSECEK